MQEIKPNRQKQRDAERNLETAAEHQGASVVKWALKFENGEMHRYTAAQIRAKFGVTHVQAGMQIHHETRGRATVLTNFDELLEKHDEPDMVGQLGDLVKEVRRAY